MSTTLEAAAAATILQLVTAGYTVDLRTTFFRGPRWRVEIKSLDGESWKGKSEKLLAAFAEALENGEEHAPLVMATMSTVDLTTELGDAWRSIAAIASEFEFVVLRPTSAEQRATKVGLEVPSVSITAHGNELGTLEVFWTLPEQTRELFSGVGLRDALERLDTLCQSSAQTTEPAPELRGNDPAPTSGTIEA
jgi:hypothetical protein